MMNLPWKRILAGLGLILAAVIIGYLLYALFFRGALPGTTPGEDPGPGGVLPTIPSGGPTPSTGVGPTGLPIEPTPATPPSDVARGGLTETNVVTTAPVSNITGNNNGAAFYQPSDGRFYRVAPDGSIATLTDDRFYNVENVTWSRTGELGVIEYPDGSNVVYNFNTDTQTTAPAHWENFSFSDDSTELAFVSRGLEREGTWLAIASASGSQPEAIEPLGANADKTTVDWSPNRQVLALQREITGADRQQIYLIGRNGENFKAIVAPGYGFQSQWSPTGSELLFSVSSATNAYKPQLWIVAASGDNIGQNRRSLGLNTWAEKCAFTSASQVICAVPRSLPDGAGLGPAIADTIPDDLYSVDLTTGQTSLLAIPNTNVSVARLTVTADEQWVFMQDATSGRLYKIAL